MRNENREQILEGFFAEPKGKLVQPGPAWPPDSGSAPPHLEEGPVYRPLSEAIPCEYRKRYQRMARYSLRAWAECQRFMARGMKSYGI